MYKLDLLAKAEDELSEAYDWYEEQLPGLGNLFYKEVNHYLTRIENNPLHFPIKYNEELRAAVLNKFPFLIIYWVDELKQAIFVASVFHTSQNPRYI